MTTRRAGALRRWTPAAAAVATFAVVVAVVATVLHLRDDVGTAPVAAAPAPLSAQVVQLRRDEVAHRVEVALTATGGATVQVEALRLRSDGFTGAGWVRLDYPLSPNGPVDFITGYGSTRCPAGRAPRLGPVRVDVRWYTDADPTRRTDVLVPRDSRALLTRILRTDCRLKRLAAQVRLAFGRSWRAEGAGADLVLHTSIEASLAPGAPPRDLTQVSGSVLYGMKPEAAAPAPLASLDAAHPRAAVPVVVSQARCTGHAKGETKQPYLFLAWVGAPGTAGTALEVPVSAADRTRLRAVCAF